MNTDRDFAAEYIAARTARHMAGSLSDMWAHEAEAVKVVRAARRAGVELNELDLDAIALRNAKN